MTRVQGGGHQQARSRRCRGAVPRRPRHPGGHVRRTEVAVRLGYARPARRPPAASSPSPPCSPTTSAANSKWPLRHPPGAPTLSARRSGPSAAHHEKRLPSPRRALRRLRSEARPVHHERLKDRGRHVPLSRRSRNVGSRPTCNNRV